MKGCDWEAPTCSEAWGDAAGAADQALCFTGIYWERCSWQSQRGAVNSSLSIRKPGNKAQPRALDLCSLSALCLRLLARVVLKDIVTKLMPKFLGQF